MITDNREQQPSPVKSLLTGILAIADFAALVFGLVMLSWLAGEMSYEGERWGLIGILFYGGIALPIMLLLLVGTLIVAVCAKRLPLVFRSLLTVCILLGLVADLIALGYVVYEPDRHRQKFADSHLVYTSGLHEAVEKGDIARVRAILEHEPQSIPALLHESDYDQYEPLHIAILRNDRPMVDLLLSYKMDDDFYGDIVNSGHSDGQMPLHNAVIAGNAEIVKLLLDHGARINDEDDEHKTALAYAQEAGNQEIVEILVKHGGALVDYEREAIEAIKKDDRSRLEELLTQKLVDPKARGALLLHYAACEGNVAMAKALIAQGAEISAAVRHLDTPLHDAANYGRVEMIRFLVSEGADPNAKNEWGIEPLGWAVTQGKTDAVRVLLELGADPNTPASTGGQSCLSIAETRKDNEVVGLLREHGAR
jgi:ankyrin repeat protein